jgi:hypothetical protein
MEKVVDKLYELETELSSNSLINVQYFSFVDYPANVNDLETLKNDDKFHNEFLDFYRYCNGFEFKWEVKNGQWQEEDISGKTNVLAFQKSIKSWKGIVHFDDTPEDSPLKKFFPVDFFADEAAVGANSTPGYRNEMFLYRFEGELIPLQLTMEGYLELLNYCRGFFYWQYGILELQEKKENLTSSKMKQYLPLIFKDFNWKQFVKMYNRYRVGK